MTRHTPKFAIAVSLACALSAFAAQAKDLYVAPNGNDAVSYSSNSINSPWKSIDVAVSQLKAGDTLYMRGGTYSVGYPMWLRSDYTNKNKGGNPAITMAAQSGTASAPVKITSYPGETATIDAARAEPLFVLDDKNYWTFEKFKVINAGTVVQVTYDGTADHITVKGLDITMSRGGDNAAAIKVPSERASNVVIQANKITGPGISVHQNTAGIWVNRLTTLKILGNVVSNVPVGIYFKHGNAPGVDSSRVNIEVAYNYIYNVGRNSARFSVSYAKIHDNVFGANPTANATVDIGPSAALPNGDYNEIYHNTFICGVGFSAEDTNSPAGAYGNTLRDNLILSSLTYHMWKTLPHETKTVNNGFGPSATVGEFSSTYSITEWLGRSLSGTGFDKATNKKGTIQFSGGSSPTKVEGFKLAAGSFGTKAASDGKDLGADITALLAQQAGAGNGGSTTVSPKPPAGLSVE